MKNNNPVFITVWAVYFFGIITFGIAAKWTYLKKNEIMYMFSFNLPGKDLNLLQTHYLKYFILNIVELVMNSLKKSFG